jgi:hypothetical protein
MSILHNHVLKYHLSDFNREVKRRNSKWKNVKTTDDFYRIKERDFLDIISSLSIIGNNVKKELIKGLDLRNSCSHPNSLIIAENTAAAHLETLILNVFQKF